MVAVWVLRALRESLSKSNAPADSCDGNEKGKRKTNQWSHLQILDSSFDTVSGSAAALGGGLGEGGGYVEQQRGLLVVDIGECVAVLGREGGGVGERGGKIERDYVARESCGYVRELVEIFREAVLGVL